MARSCWCRVGGVLVRPVTEDELAGVPRAVRNAHGPLFICRGYCRVVSTIEDGRRIAVGYLNPEWLRADPLAHRPLSVKTARRPPRDRAEEQPASAGRGRASHQPGEASAVPASA